MKGTDDWGWNANDMWCAVLLMPDLGSTAKHWAWCEAAVGAGLLRRNGHDKFRLAREVTVELVRAAMAVMFA
jgi:hypothetical protein